MVDLPIRSNKTSKKRFKKKEVGPYVLLRCVDQLVKKRRCLYFFVVWFNQEHLLCSYPPSTGSQRQRPVETWKWSWPLRDWFAFQQCASLVWARAARVKEAKINPTTPWIMDICDYIYNTIYIYIFIHKLTVFGNRKDYPIIYFDGEHERKPPILGFSNSLFFSRLPFALSYHPCSLDQCTKSEFAPWCWWWIPNIKKHAGMLPQNASNMTVKRKALVLITSQCPHFWNHTSHW